MCSSDLVRAIAERVAHSFLVDPGGGGQGLGGGCGVVEVCRTLGGLLSAGQTEFCIVFAAIFLGETLAFRRIFAILIAFFGMLVILRPGFEVLSLGRISQLVAALFFSISYLLTKKLTYNSSPFMIVAMLTVYVTIALVPFALYEWVTPTLDFVFAT